MLDNVYMRIMNRKTGTCALLLVLSFLIVFNAHATEKRLDNTFFVLERMWDRRDGGNYAITQNSFVELMIIAPFETLEWLSNKESIKTELLSKWQNTVFTDFTGKKTGSLTQLQENLIEIIGKTHFKSEKSKELKKEILRELDRMEIRAIK
jgi:hypothetical protein